MNRPDNILAYDEMDLKLGTKSSYFGSVQIILLNSFIRSRMRTKL